MKKQGYTITVLHDPNEYMKAKAEADEKAKAEKAKANAEKAAADAKAKAEADAKARAEEKAALKAEILAELKAAGVIPATTAKGTRRRCQSESRGGRQSPCRGKGSIESRDIGRTESGGRYPGDNCKGT